ncbi:CopD family protein [uncultured Sphingomonas sp.]|uniref:CopD family protein n=1 Tax=uncultured Sphingomonas sp. TaxID=158754 RepID=UPI0035C95D7B
MIGFLGSAYLWVKAAHLIFVIFWMAGLFILPRYLVHHQEALGTIEAAKWTEREKKLRRVILTPSMIIVWLLGVALAIHLGLLDGQPGLGWLHAKIALVLLLTGYHAWMLAYARRLELGDAWLSDRRLRLLNELPALFVALIVILVIVRPF